MTVNENSELRASQDLFAVLAWSPQCLPFDQIPSWHDKEDWRQFLSDVPVQAFQKKKNPNTVFSVILSTPQWSLFFAIDTVSLDTRGHENYVL